MYACMYACMLVCMTLYVSMYIEIMWSDNRLHSTVSVHVTELWVGPVMPPSDSGTSPLVPVCMSWWVTWQPYGAYNMTASMWLVELTITVWRCGTLTVRPVYTHYKVIPIESTLCRWVICGCRASWLCGVGDVSVGSQTKTIYIVTHILRQLSLFHNAFIFRNKCVPHPPLKVVVHCDLY